jgi:hypothetical protein
MYTVPVPRKGDVMQDERWRILCQEASTEKDPDRMAVLVKEINDLLEAKQKRIRDKLFAGTKNDATPQSKNALADEA